MSPAVIRKNGICPFFLKGQCNKGENCPHGHPDGQQGKLAGVPDGTKPTRKRKRKGKGKGKKGDGKKGGPKGGGKGDGKDNGKGKKGDGKKGSPKGGGKDSGKKGGAGAGKGKDTSKGKGKGKDDKPTGPVDRSGNPLRPGERKHIACTAGVNCKWGPKKCPYGHAPDGSGRAFVTRPQSPAAKKQNGYESAVSEQDSEVGDKKTRAKRRRESAAKKKAAENGTAPTGQ